MINSYWGEFKIFNIAVRKSRPNINIASILFVWQTVKTTKESWLGQYFQVNYYSNPSLGHTLPAWLESFTSSDLQGIIVFCMLTISAIVTGLRSAGTLGTSYIFIEKLLIKIETPKCWSAVVGRVRPLHFLTSSCWLSDSLGTHHPTFYLKGTVPLKN